MKALTKKLARLTNRPTCYELAVKHSDGRAFLVGYCQSKSRQAIFNMARKVGPQLVKLTGTEKITFAEKARNGAVMGEWKIVWTGRTQRNAYCEGELVFILDMEKSDEGEGH